MGHRSHGLRWEDAVKKSDWYLAVFLVVLSGAASVGATFAPPAQPAQPAQPAPHAPREDYKASLDFCVETLARVNQGLSECVDIIDRVREMDGEIYK